MILVTAQKLVHTVEDHTSHHETFLLSVPCEITFPYGGPWRPTVGVVCMCNGVTNSMAVWDDPGHSTKAGSHRGGPHFTPHDISVICSLQDHFSVRRPTEADGGFMGSGFVCSTPPNKKRENVHDRST